MANKNWWERLSLAYSRILFSIPFLLPLLIYALTAPHTVTFEDSGLFILAGRAWGIAHPPGYPLFSNLARLFTLLPFGEVAYRVSLLSVVLGAGSSLLVALIFRKLTGHVGIAVLAALMLGFSSTIWSQMIVAEVYPLNTFLCLWFFYQGLLTREQPSLRNSCILGIIGGLALANHWPIFVLAGPAYLLIPKRNWWTKKNVGTFVGSAIGVAAIWYGWMWWRSNQDPEISFLGPIKSFSELSAYIARSYYSQNDASVLHTFRDVLRFYWSFLSSAFYRDFFVLAAPFFFVGLWFTYTKRERWQFWSLFYLFGTTSFVLPHLLRFEFNILNENIFRVFWILPFVAYGYFIAEGVLWLERKKAWAGVAVLSICSLANVVLYYQSNDMHSDHFAEAYGRVILNSVPAQHKLVASTDGDVGPVSYTNKVLGVNPTLMMYTGTGVFFKDRIFDPLITSAKTRAQLTVDFIEKNEPVYSVKNIVTLANQKDLPIQFIFNGVTYKYGKYAPAKDEISAQTLSDVKSALEQYLAGLGLNNWPYHRATLAARLCNVLVLKGVEDHPAFQKSPDCQQVLARHFAATGRREQADELFMKWYKSLHDPVVTEKQEFIYHFLVNRLELVNSIKGDNSRQMKLIAEIIPIAEETLFEMPICGNRVAGVLRSIRNQVKLSSAAMAQLPLFDKCKD